MRMLSPHSNKWTNDWSWTRHPLATDLVGDLFNDFDRAVNAMTSTVTTQVNCDIHETDDHYLVSFDMPGVKKEDIKIDLQGNRLIVSGERRREHNENRKSTLWYERSYGKFERTFVLPSTIEADNIEAQYEDGVLNVALPKAEKAKPRQIQIQSGKTGFFSKLLGSKKEDVKDVEGSKAT
ncbi:MAG: low molecular weight heat shock protein [Pseudobdellovibrio sp.]|nr:low molecular weight heat shock protein [Pseudobdellovibrio sp.]